MKHFWIILVIISGCTTIPHPVTGDKISIPRNYKDKIDFDLTLMYKNDNASVNSNADLITFFETSGIFIEINTINPLIGSLYRELKVPADGNAKTSIKLYLREFNKGEITITIMPIYRRNSITRGMIRKLSEFANIDSIIPSFSNEKQRWINNKSKTELIKKLNKLMNPLGYIIIE